MEWHPYAACFPMMTGDRLESLSKDIEANGLRFPIIIDADERIIDGRNRFRACEMAGVKPLFEPFTGSDEEIRAFVVSTNLERRDLTDAQRLIAAGKLANLQHGSNQYGEKVDRPIGPSTSTTPITLAEAASMLNVSERSAKRAKVVVTEGVPELAEAVSSGDIALKPAEVIARLSKSEQPAALAEAIANPSRSRPHAKPAALDESPADEQIARSPRPGVGIEQAHAAIAELRKIPPNDPFRKRAYEIVTQYMKSNP